MPEPVSTYAIEIKDLEFSWADSVNVLTIPSMKIERGTSTFLRGPSGSGKSTLLSLITGILSPNNGDVCVLGSNMGLMSQNKRDTFRADHIGVVFQMFNLIPYLSIFDNIVLPCRFSNRRYAKALELHKSLEKSTETLLDALGLDPRKYWKQPVTELSVGQQQRVAVARALIGEPELIVADEPTSALDRSARNMFIELLSNQIQSTHASLLFVSHDPDLAPFFSNSIDLQQLNLVR